MDSQSKEKISWKQGLSIALGVPVLILPSIGYFARYVWSFAIIVWFISVLQGFIQNTVYGKLALRYPNAKGLPGFAQTVFKGKNTADYDISKFIGGFSAWGYWFAWNPVLAIFALLIGKYLHGFIPALNGINDGVISIVVGMLIFITLIIINWKGLNGGAAVGKILAVLSLTPLLAISIIPIFKGQFHFENISGYFFPDNWNFNVLHILIFFGIMAMAQWSACAWETAAVYAPDYINPPKDLPKALFFCGAICMITFLVVQSACTGVLGISGILEDPYSPMLSMAKMSLGNIGAFVAIVMLIAAMILIIQTALLGSSKAMQSLAEEGNLPKMLAKTNKHGTPYGAMLTISILNVALICMGTPSGILAASAFGYVIANGISLIAYVKASSTQKADITEKSWLKYAALICGVLNLVFYATGLMVINIMDFGLKSAVVGVFVLLLYIPLWFYSKREAKKTTISK